MNEIKIEKHGYISNIQRHSIDDGPGIRTTIFLSGCPMHCSWCHNPEAMIRKPRLLLHKKLCTGVEACIDACPRNVLSLTPEGISVNTEGCDMCGKCADACPTGAIEMSSKTITVADAAAICAKDKVFYDKSGGGVTISGGEPSMQWQFVLSLIHTLKEKGIHVALDTCGGTRWEKIAPLADAADLVLYDLKIMHADKHLKHTGIHLENVLENAKNISKTGTPMWIRTPIIPGVSDDEDNIIKVANFISSELPTVEKYELLAFNKLCAGKYESLNLPFQMEDAELITENTMNRLTEAAKKSGTTYASWKGMTKMPAT